MPLQAFSHLAAWHASTSQVDGNGLNKMPERTFTLCEEGEFANYLLVKACTPFHKDAEKIQWGGDVANNPLLMWSAEHPRACIKHLRSRELSKSDASRRSAGFTFIAIKDGHPDCATNDNPFAKIFANLTRGGGPSTGVTLRGWRLHGPRESIETTSVKQLLVVEASRDGKEWKVRIDTGTWD